MALFGPKLSKQESRKAKAIAKRGVRATARIEAMSETGATREEVAREYEFELSFKTESGDSTEVTTRQFMNDLTLTGLAPGEEAEISYDRDDPSTIVVHGSPKYRVIQSQGELVVVPVAEAGPG